ncbi:MAG: hypothetical protein Q7I93_07400 [Syntrophales bacterium]|nr:hypothetical protein [Syntrophales bacterium]
MNHHILYNKKLFLEQVIEKLGAYPIDYAEKLQTIRKTGNILDPHLQAGVLLLLSFREKNSPEKENPPSPPLEKGGWGDFQTKQKGSSFFG